MVLQYRMLSKLNSTYVDGLAPLIGADGKIRAHFQQTVTATGRISCTEPNLQNIPIRTDLGRQLRKAFVAGCRGCTLVGADYSQIELRILAHLSGDESLIDAFNNGDDIHRITAARVFNLDYDQGHAAGPEQGQGGQFRRDLRHERLRPFGEPADHQKKKRSGISKTISTSIWRSRPIWTGRWKAAGRSAIPPL